MKPVGAFYHEQMGEYILRYEDVRCASSPTATLLEFLQSTYEAAAISGKWDREALERPLEISPRTAKALYGH